MAHLTFLLTFGAVATGTCSPLRLPLRRQRPTSASTSTPLSSSAALHRQDVAEDEPFTAVWPARIESFDLVADFNIGIPIQAITLSISLLSSYVEIRLSSTSATCDSKTAGYDPLASTTCWHKVRNVDPPVGVQSGDLYRDTFADLPQFEFIGITTCSTFGGVLGLAPKTSGGPVHSTWQQLVSPYSLQNVIFAIYMTGDTQGEIVFGGGDDSVYTGELNYLPLVSHAVYWMVSLDDVDIAGVSYSATGSVAMIDPGSLFLFVPTREMEALAQALGLREASDGLYRVDCVPSRQRPAPTITLGSVAYQLDEDLLVFEGTGGECVSAIQSHSSDFWRLGVPFARMLYTIFDGEEHRIGVAPTVSGIAMRDFSILP